jgi:GT2 family glycosyltransferase
VAGPETPEISIVVPSHSRRLRLRWLLNALEEQTLDRGRWEVIVATTNDELAQVVREHPVGARHVRPHASSPAAQRNAGWRAARAPLVLFTDDDCRPQPEWAERMLRAAAEHPGAIVQGETRADPIEWAVGSSPHSRTLDIIPPGPYAQTCNILYPRAVLERCDGFDEAFPGPAGEDSDLAERAKALGAPYAGAPGALVYHAVEGNALPAAIRQTRKWVDVPYLVKRHPHLRRDHGYPLRIFWRATHFRLALALLGLALARRFPPLVLLVLPYAGFSVTRGGRSKRALFVGAVELPGQAVVDAAEMLTLAQGSVKHRTLVL